MREPLRYCSMAWPIQPTVLPRAKSATAPLQTNVEFYTALLLHGLGLPSQIFTPAFAVGRVAGWTAHCFEQRTLDRLIRPQSVYVGSSDRSWVPLEER
jgi:citrate synthase